MKTNRTNFRLAACLSVAFCSTLLLACGDEGDSAQVDGGAGTGADGGISKHDSGAGGSGGIGAGGNGGNLPGMKLGPMAVELGAASEYVVLAKAAVSATVGTKVVGNVGISPAAESFITGFSQMRDSTNTFSSSVLVTGKVEASNMAVPTPARLTAAIGSMETAYIDAAGRTAPNFTERGAGDISGLTLVPGLYKWSSGVLVASAVTLSGGANDVWIFQIAQNFTLSNGVAVTLAGGARAENIFWQVGGQASLGTTSSMQGTILSKTQIVLKTGASLKGRAFAQTAVTLDANAVTKP